MVGSKKSWKKIEAAIKENIQDPSRKRHLFTSFGDKGLEDFDITSKLGVVHFHALGNGAYGKVWKVSTHLSLR